MQKKYKTRFIVSLTMPSDVTIPEMCEYIRRAVSSDKGSYHIDEPIARLKSKSVTVKSGMKGGLPR